MKTVLIIRSLDISSDSRVQRYEKYFEKYQVSYTVLGWDRENKNLKRKSTDYCTIQAGYNLGTGGIKYRIKWNIYVLKYLLKNKKNYDIIHACDFDTILPALVMKLFGKTVVFDIFDWFSDEVKTGKWFIDYPINFMEKLATKLADMTILCEEERIEQIQTIPRKYMIIPNIPTVDLTGITCIPNVKGTPITIAYVGGFYPDRGLIELLEVISTMPTIQLKIAGFGNVEIEDKAREYAELHSNIEYYGKVEYNKAIEIMQSADLLYAMYYTINRNNIYAAPNKFYEAIFLNKPIITTQKTLVGKKVQKHESGYVIEEGRDALEKFLQKLSLEDIQSKKNTLIEYSSLYKDTAKESMEQYITYIKNR
ncbi:glycosyltransferase [Niameybacter massiliensis]|uniref:glycosyltransferase n=1 Tax=Niameybacter massiliensis TaxID=1658108 RepID=UPI0006B59F0C|nr:glycosyltransferase [Niameybacter massiliensis]